MKAEREKAAAQHLADWTDPLGYHPRPEPPYDDHVLGFAKVIRAEQKRAMIRLLRELGIAEPDGVRIEFELGSDLWTDADLDALLDEP